MDEPTSHESVDLIRTLVDLSSAVDCTKDEMAKAHLLEGMRVVLDTVEALTRSIAPPLREVEAHEAPDEEEDE